MMNLFFENRIFDIETEHEFRQAALDVFRFQASENPVYKRYMHYLNLNPDDIQIIEKIPFLPIEFFKTHHIISGTQGYDTVFTSSGTTSANTSKHYVPDIAVYEQSFLRAFNYFYGNPQEYTILALLPSYLEREGSSLIYMARKLIQMSNDSRSGFYLRNYSDLATTLKALETENRKVLLIGVSFALIELAQKYPLNLKNTIVMETGGMKGQRKEITRPELHRILSSAFGVKHIHSEYGMTELLSQAYSNGQQKFRTPPWMRILVRDIYDPFSYLPSGRSGAVNVIDLANFNSCSFIETKDLGRMDTDGRFEIIGRFDNSDIRGCNLMVEK